ncbi:hypothetical protein ACPA9J_25900 [Pseudomonas aeruginosa]
MHLDLRTDPARADLPSELFEATTSATTTPSCTTQLSSHQDQYRGLFRHGLQLVCDTAASTTSSRSRSAPG